MGGGPYGMADWYYRNMRDAASYQAYLARIFASNCRQNFGSVDGRQIAHDAAVSGLKGGVRNAAIGLVRGGPDGALAGALNGLLLSPIGGAAKSVLRQACYR